jgi:hypothetical protein
VVILAEDPNWDNSSNFKGPADVHAAHEMGGSKITRASKTKLEIPMISTEDFGWLCETSTIPMKCFGRVEVGLD